MNNITNILKSIVEAFCVMLMVSIVIIGAIYCVGLLIEKKEKHITEFILFEAKEYNRIVVADYNIMRKTDTTNSDGTNRSTYFFVGDTLVKAGYIEFETIKACANINTKNKFALIKREDDFCYSLVRLTYNEPNTVVIADTNLK